MNNNVNCFFLDKNNVLFFNIFIKNSKLYLITPLHKTFDININKINIYYKEKSIRIHDVITKSQYESTQILIYKFPFNNKENYEIKVKYNNFEKIFNLQNIKTIQNKKLTLTTLFQTDYKLITIFYDYYKRQGVEHFYMYYNGPINEEIQKCLSTIVDFEINFEEHGRNLDINIKHPNYDSRPISMGSGAEKTIAAMAIRLALIEITNLPKSTLFIMDEPATALDQEHMEGFIRLLQ